MALPHDLQAQLRDDQARRLRFDMARIEAIKQYSRIEQNLCGILRVLLDCDPKAGKIVFFGISNTRARYAMIYRLAKYRFGGFYAKSWPKIESWLTPIDATRNKIVHWVEGHHSEPPDWSKIPQEDWDSHHVKIDSMLYNAIYHEHDELPERLTQLDLDAFYVKAKEMEILTRVLFRAMMMPLSPKASWNKFDQPIKHRTPAEFLSTLMNKGPSVQQPPFEQ